jgi:Zn-dependent protease/CBS domain-containing protein
MRLFSLMGFEVKADTSWILLAVLITWTLSVGYFPHQHEGLSATTYWLMGGLGALGLFLSIIVHEFSHSLVARRNGMSMRGITLFVFGGVAEMNEEPPSAKVEFLMAVVGPLTSLALAGLFYVLYAATAWSAPVGGVISYLALLNVLLAAFNLLPAFPLDGGRMLRAALWGIRKNLRWATRIATGVGIAFGVVLIVAGVLEVLRGDFIGGMWWFLIGLFLQDAAKGSYQQLLLRRSLQGEPVSRFMKTDPITVPPSLSLDRFVEDFVYRHHHKMFPVAENGRLLACVSTREVKETPREEWSETAVEDVAEPCTPENSIKSDTDAVEALSLMNRTGASRLLVKEKDTLLGIVALKDLLKFIALKVELEP